MVINMNELTTKEILEKAKIEKNHVVPSIEQRNLALKCMAEELILHTAQILQANQMDVEQAKDRISNVMLDRLILDEKRIHAMADGITDVIALEDPTGIVLSTQTEESGIEISKVSVPFGVVSVIYESRPNVTSDAAALILKSGNVAILRSGKDAWNTANEIVRALRMGLTKAAVHPDRIQLIQDKSHDSANALMTANGYVDLLIPRGGASLIKRCVENATVPVIETGTGICHIYVDDSADIEMALNIVENAKCSRPSVCNAEEVLLVNASIANEFLPKLQEKIVEGRKENPVELRLDETASQIISGTKANPQDFDTEFLDYVLAVKIVENVEEAVSHINAHSTKHSESIVSNTQNHIDYFTQNIDSACVYVNASTRFTDGGEFGLGCEIGISTQKLHARGPMGLRELCTYKYIIQGNGQIR